MNTDIIIIGTIHQFHLDNKFYNYNDIFSTIERFNPDVIGVEIRQEDLSQCRDYLNSFYPYEMIEAKFKYETQCSIYGFDWFEKSVEGKLLTNDYFSNLDKSKLEKDFELDPSLSKERTLLDIIDETRFELIFNHNISEVNNGIYDSVIKIYHKQLDFIQKNTSYEKLITYRKDRDEHIDENIINIISKNEGKKIILIMGLDHRSYAIDAIKNTFHNKVNLIDIK